MKKFKIGQRIRIIKVRPEFDSSVRKYIGTIAVITAFGTQYGRTERTINARMEDNQVKFWYDDEIEPLNKEFIAEWES